MDAFVAQYQLKSMDALENKLAQFPAGTNFRLSVSGPDSPARREIDTALRAFLTAHGMAIVSGG